MWRAVHGVVQVVTWAGAMLPAALTVPTAPTWGAVQLSLRWVLLCVSHSVVATTRGSVLLFSLLLQYLPLPPHAFTHTRLLAHRALSGLTENQEPTEQFVRMLENIYQSCFPVR